VRLAAKGLKLYFMAWTGGPGWPAKKVWEILLTGSLMTGVSIAALRLGGMAGAHSIATYAFSLASLGLSFNLRANGGANVGANEARKASPARGPANPLTFPNNNNALAESEDRFRRLVEALPDAIFVVSENRVVFVNPGGVRLLRAQRAEEIVGKDISEIIHRDSMDSIRGRIRKSYASGVASPPMKHVMVALDGSLVEVESASIPILWNGAPAIEAICRDLTERKRAEQSLRLFRALIDQSHDAIELLDPETLRFLDMNDRTCLDLGYSREELLSMSVYDIDPTVNEAVHRRVQEELKDSGSIVFETLHRRKDGSMFPVEVSIKHVELDRPYRVCVARDISERKRTEQSLRLFRALIDQSNDSILVLDPETVALLDMNGRACLEFGYSREELLAMTVYDINPVADEEMIRQIRQQLEDSGSAVFETVNRRKDGSIFPVEVSVKQVHLDRIYRVSVVRNIAERKRAEQSLRLFRALIDQSQDAIELIDHETLRFLDMNDRACLDLGYSREELLSMSICDIAPLAEGDLNRRVKEELEHSGFSIFETLHRRKDGSTFPVEVSVKRVHIDREYRVCVARDITERKRAEQSTHEWQKRLELAEKASLKIGLWDWDMDGNTAVWSDETYRQWGYTRDPFSGRVEDVVAQVVSRIHPEDRHRVEAAIQRIQSGETEEYAEQYRVVRPDGTICWIDAYGIVVRNGSPHMLGIGIDITERKKNQQSLEQAKMELTRVARIATMGELTASIAHEINQPLAAIATNASAALRWLAAQPPNVAEAQTAMSSVRLESDRASLVIKRVRALLTKTAPELRRVDVNEVIREVLVLAHGDLVIAGVAVRTELCASISAVLGDRVQLQQVIMNLVTNAIDAMAAVTDRRRMVVIKSAEDAEGVLVQVLDFGKGLESGDASRIFDSFFTTKPEGIGMGLSISRSIIEAHGGRLWATPGSPYGAVFQWILPKADKI
jgi:PAS domain S-box-containing protein